MRRCSEILKGIFQTALCKLLPEYTDCSLVQQSPETSDSPAQIQNIDKTSVIPLLITRTSEFLLCTRQKVTACILFIGSHSLDLEPCVDWIYLRYGFPLVLLYLFRVESCYCQDSGHRDWCLFLPLVRILLWDEDCTPDTVSSWDSTLESFVGWWCLCTGLRCFRVWCLSVASLEAFLRSQLSAGARLRMTVLWMLSKRAQHCSLPRFWRLIFFNI